ncbi:MAG TPA: hydantoinase B/oxoprolinase family protein [Candidatus Dormibacteraeota bacterium]|nr:hydantoinase B/oxoprolinase family protein [Candidatus Dormibacteraeota bacterium]
MRTDPVLLEILRNRLKAIAEEMAAVTLRTGFTVFVKETSDFGACLVAPNGEVMSAPTDTAVSLMVGLPAWEVIDALGPYEEGDIGITNDPDITHGLSTHLPDIWLWKPIFAEGRIIGYGFNFIHSSDVGGKVAGSISPSSYEIFQEGVRVPPMKLFRKGEPNQDLIKLLLANSRIPEQNWGDIKAQIASLNVAERRLHELVARYGREVVSTGIEDLMDHAEQRSRELIRRIPDGDYSFTDYLEVDVADAGQVRIKLNLRVRGTDMTLDFEGTDYQVQAAFNLPTWNQRGHYMVCFPILNFFRTLDPEVPYNSGLVRPIELKIPRGTIMNPEPGAAYGVRAATMFRVLDILNGCLTQALPEIIPAASSGGIAIVLVSTLDPVTGERRVSVAQPLNGGSGGRPRQDGIDGTSFTGGWLRNIPNEVLEADMPVLVEEYGYRENSAGAGLHRGGCGIRFRLRTLAPETLMTARGLERFVFRPYGLRGGKPGERYRVTLNPGTERPRDLGKIDVLTLEAGEVIEFETSSGGGFGDPFDRDPQRVLEDVRSGLLSAELAERDYGVVIRDGSVDAEATETLRTRRPERGRELVDVGPERRAYEEVWSDELMTELLRLLSAYPTSLRPVVRNRVRRWVDHRGRPVSPGELAPVVEEIARAMGLKALEPEAAVTSR